MNFFHQYDQNLTSEELTLVEKAQRFCAGPFSESVHAAHKRGEPFPAEWVSRWAGEGMLGLQAKRADGGFGASYLCKIRVAQEMAQHSFAAAFCMNHHQGSVTRISHGGSSRQREELLKPMLSGAVLATSAMSEPSGGSDVAALSATARPVEGGWLLNGTKTWLTNGMMVNQLILLARTEGAEGSDSIASFLVDCGNESSVERREIVVSGARSFRFAEITFRDHFIPEWAMFIQPGEAFKSSMTTVNAARVHVAAMCVAALYAALSEAALYCDARHSFGKSLLSHQGLRWELAEVATRLEAANALVFRAAHHIDQGDVIVSLAAQCKKFAVDTAIWGVDQCMRAMGAIGASDVHRLNMLYSEVRMAAYGDGTNEILLDRIGRGLAKEYGYASHHRLA